jgi:hypothetical protein
MNHGANGTRLEQPRYMILPREIARYQISCRARIHIDGQGPSFGGSQQATNFTPDVPAGASDNHGMMIADRSHVVILHLLAATINTGLRDGSGPKS